MLLTAMNKRKDIILKPEMASTTTSIVNNFNDANQKQIEFFLKLHEKKDNNLKKNFDFILTSLKRREEIDKKCEREFLKMLNEKEIKHIKEKDKSYRRSVEEFNKIKNCKIELIQSKKIQHELDEKRLVKWAAERRYQIDQEKNYNSNIEENHKKTVNYYIFLD